MKAPSKVQRQAIMHLQGPAEIIAGPGSGKTFTIIHRILYLINQCQISPDNILVITYTKAAALEMKERYELALSKEKKSYDRHVHFGTFHSVCYHILQQSGYVRAASLIKEADRRRLVQTLIGNLGLPDSNVYDMVSYILNEISRRKNSVETAAPICYFEITEEAFEKIYCGYDNYLKEQKLIDFDDMITECLNLLMNHPAVCETYRKQFRYILADEFQDINIPQYRILKLLAAPQNNLFVVGDDDQAIYGFRGATPGIMKQFTEEFPEGKQIQMTENYRSGSQIVSIAERMIERNKERFPKQFLPVKKGGSVQSVCFINRREEEQALLQSLSKLEPEELNDTAIILRTNLEAMQYRELLQKNRISLRGMQKKQSLCSTFIFSDFLAFLSYIYLGNKRSDLIRFMNKPDRFLLRESLPGETVSKEQVLQYYRGNIPMQRKIEKFFSMLELAGDLNPRLAISLFRGKLGYDQYLKCRACNIQMENLYKKQADELQAILADYSPGSSLQEFTDKITEQEEAKQGIEFEETKGVSVITMHASKGLEFDRVYLPDVNEGIIPGKKNQTSAALEEERRLLYVAITRARNTLIIFYTKERNRKLSRFLQGIILPP